MNKIKLVFSLSVILFTASCTKQKGIGEDTSAINSASSSNFSKIFDISNDNSGLVKITPLGNGVTSSTISFGHGTGTSASATVTPGSFASHNYPEGSYTVTITSTDLAGKTTTATYPLVITYRAPENIVITTGADMTVKATAQYANSFLVYYGDVANEVGTPMALGQTLPAHIYPASATPFVLKVVALSGGAATTFLTKTLFGPPIDFETAAVDYFFGTFGGGQGFTTVANPSATGLNTSSKVGKFVRGFDSWSGTYSPLNVPINFAHGKKIKVLAYNPDPALIGKMVNVELEAAIAGTGATANGVGVLKVPFTTSGAWEELTFDFSTIPAIPATARFAQLVLRFNDAFNGNGVGGTGAIIYLDNFRVTP